MDNLVDQILNFIISKYSEGMMCNRFDDEVMNWVDEDVMEEEGIDEYEYYSEYGHGEAENKLSIKLTSVEKILAFKKIKEHYECFYI